MRSICLALVFSLLLPAVALAVPPEKADWKDQVDENPELPRVLLIGDSISIGYTVPVRKKLLGKANVIRPRTNCAHTRKGLQHIDAWLGDGKWDVIHFNWGLHDLKYLNPNGKPLDGAHQVPIEEYEKNLDKLVARLKQTGAVLIWRNTTPVPAGTGIRFPGDELAYNEAAARVMKKHDVATHDLHAFAKERQEKIQKRADVHFTPEGSEQLADDVVRVLLPHLE